MQQFFKSAGLPDIDDLPRRSLLVAGEIVQHHRTVPGSFGAIDNALEFFAQNFDLGALIGCRYETYMRINFQIVRAGWWQCNSRTSSTRCAAETIPIPKPSSFQA